MKPVDKRQALTTLGIDLAQPASYPHPGARRQSYPGYARTTKADLRTALRACQVIEKKGENAACPQSSQSLNYYY
jgi:hypothetical protein